MSGWRQRHSVGAAKVPLVTLFLQRLAITLFLLHSPVVISRGLLGNFFYRWTVHLPQVACTLLKDVDLDRPYQIYAAQRLD